jgi:ribosomal-protein-alanine N-acetyltransferase
MTPGQTDRGAASTSAEPFDMFAYQVSPKGRPGSCRSEIGRTDGSSTAHSMFLMKSPQVDTDRLVLRRWTDEDRVAFAQINADPEVMRYRGRTLTGQESNELSDAFEACFEQHGFGQSAVERTEDHRLTGFIGLELANEDMPFRPVVHIGLRLAFDAWHHGYATERAQTVLQFAFDVVGLSEVVAHTTARNERSQAVMRRLGMTHDPSDDFDGPWYPAGHPSRRSTDSERLSTSSSGSAVKKTYTDSGICSRGASWGGVLRSLRPIRRRSGAREAVPAFHHCDSG